MKKVITTAICALAFACASAAGNVEPGDSIECFSHPDSVAFVHGGSSVELKVFGTKDNPDYYYSYRRDVSDDGTEISKEGNSGWDFTLPFIDRTEKGEKRTAYSFECGGLRLRFRQRCQRSHCDEREYGKLLRGIYRPHSRHQLPPVAQRHFVLARLRFRMAQLPDDRHEPLRAGKRRDRIRRL